MPITVANGDTIEVAAVTIRQYTKEHLQECERTYKNGAIKINLTAKQLEEILQIVSREEYGQ